ncbi:MAG: substrate-binding domain-containing protein [Acidimicrobiaceae bacterium]|nr:substrate-binding domain-containing protein [Acidimicrobiaceae bacterium]
MRIINTRLVRALAGAVGAVALLAAACSDGDGGEVAEPAVTADTEPGAVQDPEAGADAPEPVAEEPEPVADDTEPVAAVTEPEAGPEEAPPEVQDEPLGPPYVAELAWGNFELAERIAAKLEAGERLNFVVSLVETGEGSAAAALGHGWSQGAGEAAEVYDADVNARVVGPNSADAEAQAGIIESLVASGDIDCLAVQTAGLRLLTGAVDAAVEAGVPVFAVGGDSPDSKRFAFFGIDAYEAGHALGGQVGEWAAAGGLLMRRGGVLTGDAGDQQSFDLMRGFVAGFGEIHSGLEWVNTPTDVESLGFEPFAVYDATEAWVLDNLDADMVFHTDAGIEQLAAVMADQLLYGDMYAVGFHVNEAVLDYIRERLVAAAVPEGLSEQARLAARACGDFLLGGALETGHVVITPAAVTLDTIDDTDWTLAENQ